MFDAARLSEVDLQPLDTVVSELLSGSSVRSDDLMVVGAACRDLLHRGLGLTTGVLRTADVDVGLVVSDLDSYTRLTRKFPPIATRGNDIRFRIAGLAVDLIPFGAVEDPPGAVSVSKSSDHLSVVGFREVHAAAYSLPLPSSASILLPSVPGFAALKLAGWLDRSEYGHVKDG